MIAHASLEVLDQAYVLILFENFEYDYRESLLEVRPFSNHIVKYPEVEIEAWNKIAHLQRENAKKYM